MTLLPLCLAFLAAVILIALRKTSTQQNAPQQELQEPQQEQQNASTDLNEVHKRLLSTISHDLRNPVIAQRNMLELLSQAGDNLSPAMLKEQHQLLLCNTQSQIDLILNLLCWARLKLGITTYTPIKFNLMSAVAEAIDMHRIAIASKQIEVRSRIAPNTIVEADKVLTVNAVSCLLSNAIKFSYPNGNVEITAKVIDPQWWGIAVADQGVGLSAEQLVEVVSPTNSQRSTSLGTQGEQGSGFGLDICREILRHYGGQIYAESQPNAGSTFTITIPNGND